MTQFSSNTATSRVVSLNNLGRDRSPGQRILSECRDQLVIGLCNWLRDIATPVSEELFVLADSTRDRLQQTRYLDLRADIEQDWAHLVETFRRDLSAEAERCQNQEAPKEGLRGAPLEIPDFEGLQLVDDEDLSEHIVIREFSAQLSESCDGELYTLTRRIAALLGHDDLIDSANPLSPAIVCRALSNACSTIGADAEARLLLMRRLERHLHAGLPPIYQQINAYLIERGILPDLKRNYRKSSVLGESAISAQATQRTSGTASATPAALSGDTIMEALQRLAQARGGNAQPALTASNFTGGFGTPGSLPAGSQGQGVALDSAVINQLLLSSLNEMQHTPAASEPGGGIINQVRLVRESENAQQIGGLESVTIDIVAMLFDFIFDDTHIPVAIKALISRLQIPVLKVAMLNPGFFADRQHPTRRFLGSVSGVSIRWGSSVDETDPFYCKLAELVERIQTEFENDVEIFGTALEELQTFVNENEGIEDNTALTAANLVIQREQDAEGLERAQRAVRLFRANTPLPRVIEAFLEEHWTAVLHKIGSKENDEGAHWKAATEAMQDLAWSIKAKKNPEDRLKLISLLPKMLGLINKGLDSVNVDTIRRNAFFDELVKYHAAALKGEMYVASEPDAPSVPERPELTPTFAPSSEGNLQVTHCVDNGVEVEEVILVGASPVWRASDRDIFRQVSELRRGDWVEFLEEDGHTNRERLNWISPQRGILLFSNHRSAKAISITPDALARQIRDGKAAILQEDAIFERALSGALESINAG